MKRRFDFKCNTCKNEIKDEFVGKHFDPKVNFLKCPKCGKKAYVDYSSSFNGMLTKVYGYSSENNYGLQGPGQREVGLGN